MQFAETITGFVWCGCLNQKKTQPESCNISKTYGTTKKGPGTVLGQELPVQGGFRPKPQTLTFNLNLELHKP